VSQSKANTQQLVLFLTYLSFCWTLPLKHFCGCRYIFRKSVRTPIDTHSYGVVKYKHVPFSHTSSTTPATPPPRGAGEGGPGWVRVAMWISSRELTGIPPSPDVCVAAPSSCLHTNAATISGDSCFQTFATTVTYYLLL
jgi:hypothetical protein